MHSIPVFAGLGSETLFSNSVLDQAARDAKTPEGQSLLQACLAIFQEEIAARDEESISCGVNAEDFSNVKDLLCPSQSYHTNAAVQHSFLCLAQLLRYMSLETSFSTKLLAASGFCAGLLPAVAAATSKTTLQYLFRAQECYRVAVKIGVASEIFRRSISPSSTDQPWSLIVDGLSLDETKKLLSESNDSEQSIPLFVSARNSEKCVTISGEGTTLHSRVKSILPGRCRTKQTNVFSLYHDAENLTKTFEAVLQDIKEGDFSFPSLTDLTCPLFCTKDGSKITSDQASQSHPDQLLKSILSMIFLHPVDWISVQENILSTAKAAADDDNIVQVQNFGPGYGALVGHKNIPSSIQVQDVATAPRSANEWSESDIAIVGMALDVPEAEEDTNRLWQNIMDGINTCSKIPENRFIIEDYHQDDKSQLGNSNRSMDTQYGSFLENPFLFDNAFFGISPREARSMDPQQRLLLQTAQRALEDAGYVPNATKTFQIGSFGCYIGAATGDYADNLKEEMDVYWVPGVLRSFLSGRISYAYGWGGPALTVDTACSSSIVAIWQAARALQAGDANACLAGGVNVVTSPDMYIGLDRAHFLSPTGQCKSFDDPVDGYCRADGVACIVMKRMSDALAENDRILGVIRGVEVNQSGTAHSITHPHTPTQEILFKSTWRKNGIDPLSVSVVEAHGTGTGAGDPSELHGITNSLCEGRSPKNPLNIGSIKGNVGHSEAASGAVSLIKILLMFKNQTIPPQTLFNKPNSNLADLAKRGVVINREAIPWKRRNGKPRLAMLNNFGGSGSNGSLIVQDYEPTGKDELPSEIDAEGDPLTYPFGCSTKSEEALLLMRDQIVALLKNNGGDISLKDVCYTSTARRQIYGYRLSTTASSIEELISNLENPEIVETQAPKFESDPATAVFLFSGQGSQYLGMGKELMAMYPLFEATINQCHKLLTKWGMPSCLDVVMADPEAEADLNDPTQQRAFQVAVFALEVGIARQLISFGLKPKAVAGHSLGEYAALVIAGVLDLPSALKLVAYRAKLIVTKCSLKKTGMLAAGLSAEELAEVLEQDFQDLSIAGDNSPDDCVVGGPTSRLDDLKNHLKEQLNVRATVLNVPVAYHTSAMEPVVEPLIEYAKEVKMSPPSIPVASNFLGRVVDAGEEAFNAEYFASHCRETVQFNKSMESLLSSDEAAAEGCWIDIGPHATTLPMLRTRISNKKAVFLTTLKKNSHPVVSMSETLSQLYSKTNGLSWRQIFEGMHGKEKLTLLPLPGVPFMKKEFHVQYPRDYVTEDQREKAFEEEYQDETPYHFLSKIIKDPLVNPDGHGIYETPLRNLAEYISGHTVCGFALCPASVFCELALSAAHLIGEPGMTHSLSNMVIRKSLVYQEDMLSRKDLDVVVRVNINNIDPVRGLLEFVISSFDRKNESEHVQVHSQGTIKSRPSAETRTKHQKLAGLLEQRHTHYAKVDTDIVQVFSGSVLYDRIFTNTVEYSEMYRSIETIKIDSDSHEAFAACKLLPSRQAGKFGADPILMDVLIHVPGFMANLSVAKGKFWICKGIKSSTVLRDMVSEDGKFSIHCNNFPIEDGKNMLSDVQAYDSKDIFAVMKSIQFELVESSDRAAAFKILAQRSEGDAIVEQVEQAFASEEVHRSSSVSTFAFSSASQTPISSTRSSPPSSSESLTSTARESKASTKASTPLGGSLTSLPEKTEEKEETSEEYVMAEIQKIMIECCGNEASEVQPDTNLEKLGVDSLMVHEICDEMSKVLNVEIPIAELTKCNTIREAAALVNIGGTSPSGKQSSTIGSTAPTPPKIRMTQELRNSICHLLRLNESVQLVQSAPSKSLNQHPFFLIHPGSGLTVEYNRIRSLQRTLYTISNPCFFEPGTRHSVGDIAKEYARLISATHEGPYLLGGWSFGGLISVETARLLADLYGCRAVVGVILVDTPPPMTGKDMSLPQATINAAVGQEQPSGTTPDSDVHQAIRELVKDNFAVSSRMVRAYSKEVSDRFKDAHSLWPRVVMVRATESFAIPGITLPDHPWLSHAEDSTLAMQGWEAVAGKGKVTMKGVHGDHFNMFSSRNIAKTSEALVDACTELQDKFEQSGT